MASSTESRPTLLVLSIEEQSLFDAMYGRLIALLSSKATLQWMTEPGRTLDYLQTESPSAVLATDAGILKSSHAAVLNKLTDYVREGGTVVLCGLFSSFIRRDEVKPFFERHFGLPWELGAYHRTDVYLNRHAITTGGKRFVVDRLEAGYSQKANFLKNVAKEAAVYLPNEHSRTQSMVFANESVDVNLTPIAFVKVGKGWLGYIGDVNAEEGSDQVVMAMCGL